MLVNRLPHDEKRTSQDLALAWDAVLACNGIWSENCGVKFAYFMPPFAVALCVTAFTLAGADFQQSFSQDSKRSMSDAPVYFPPGLPNGEFFAAYLNFMGEPSLLEAAKDASITSYRLSWLGGKTGRVVAVRLTVNSNGDGQITSEVASGSPTAVRKGNNTVSASDVQKLLQLVESAKFWSMRPTEQKTDGDTGHKFTELDGTFWIVEGVRNGSYYSVYRRTPDSNSFTEIGRYLAKDLAKLDDSAISIPKYVSPGQ